MSTKTSFPLVVRSGSATVKVHRVRPGQPGEYYEVRFYSEGAMRRRSSSDLERARADAKLAAHRLAAGELEVLKLVGQDCQEYLAAKKNLQGPALPLTLATKCFLNLLKNRNLMRRASAKSPTIRGRSPRLAPNLQNHVRQSPARDHHDQHRLRVHHAKPVPFPDRINHRMSWKLEAVRWSEAQPFQLNPASRLRGRPEILKLPYATVSWILRLANLFCVNLD